MPNSDVNGVSGGSYFSKQSRVPRSNGTTHNGSREKLLAFCLPPLHDFSAIEADRVALNADILACFSRGHGEKLTPQSEDLKAYRRAIKESKSLDPETILKVAEFGICNKVLCAGDITTLGNALGVMIYRHTVAPSFGMRFIGMPGMPGEVPPGLVQVVAMKLLETKAELTPEQMQPLLIGCARTGHANHPMTLELFGTISSHALRSDLGDPVFAGRRSEYLATLRQAAEFIDLGSLETIQNTFKVSNGELAKPYNQLPIDARGGLLTSWSNLHLLGTKGLDRLISAEVSLLRKEELGKALSFRRMIAVSAMREETRLTTEFRSLDKKFAARLEELYQKCSLGDLVEWYSEMRKAGMISPAEKTRFEKEMVTRLDSKGSRGGTIDEDVIGLCDILTFEKEVSPEFRSLVLRRADDHLRSPDTFNHAVILSFLILAADPSRADHVKQIFESRDVASQARFILGTLELRFGFLLRACLDIEIHALASRPKDDYVMSRDGAGYNWVNRICDGLARRLPDGAKIRSEGIGLVEGKAGDARLLVGFPHLLNWTDLRSPELRGCEEVEQLFVKNLRPDIQTHWFARCRSDEDAMRVVPSFDHLVLDFAYQGTRHKNESGQDTEVDGIGMGQTVQFD